MRVFCLFADKNDEIELNKRAFLKKNLANTGTNERSHSKNAMKQLAFRQ